jgi:uncharacterized membrane protein YkvI
MKLLSARAVRVYFIPGAIFQSVLIGGGYGTGREIIEFFTRFGSVGGLMGMAVAMLCWAAVLGATYEFARIFRVYDYRSFFKTLIGPAWIFYEFLFILMFLLVLAVVASAAGEILLTRFGISYAVGITGMLTLVAVLAFFGRDLITKVLAWWSVLLYATFFVYFVLACLKFGGSITAQLSAGEVGSGWAVSGLQYALYNLFIVPVILFSTRDIETRGEAVGSGFVAAFMCIFPAVLFHLSFMADYPAILERGIPLDSMISLIGVGGLVIAYLVVLCGTFIETGAGMIQGLNERIDGFLEERTGRPLSKPARGMIAVIGVSLAAGLSTVGIITLIGKGYSTISWGFLAVYVLPILTIGIHKIYQQGSEPVPVAASRGQLVGVGRGGK